MPVSRMVVFPRRDFVSPFSDQDVDCTCQKPCELCARARARVSASAEGGAERAYLSTAVYVIGFDVTVGSM